MAATDVELGLAAAVREDPLPLAVVVDVEQVLPVAGTRGLDVQRARRERARFDVRHGVDRAVPGDAVAVGRQRCVRLGNAEVGILEPDVRERLGDAPVELGVGGDVGQLVAIVALEVDRIDGSGRRDLLEEPRRCEPVGHRVELEAQVGVGGEPLRHRLERRGVAQPEAGDEMQRPRRAAEHLVQALAGLAQCEVGGCRLEAPATVVGILVGELRPHVWKQVERREVLGELAERERAGERVVRAAVDHGLRDRRPLGDVLAATLSALAVEHVGGGDPIPARFHFAAVMLDRVPVDLELEIGEQAPGTHRAISFLA